MSIIIRPREPLKLMIINNADPKANLSLFVKDQVMIEKIELPVGGKLTVEVPLETRAQDRWEINGIELNLGLMKIHMGKKQD